MGIFNRKPANCTICNKQISHKNKAKKGWGVKSPLCSDCYIDQMQQAYDASIRKKCVICGTLLKLQNYGNRDGNGIWMGCFVKNALTKRNQILTKRKIFAVFVVTNLVCSGIIQKISGR